MLTAERIHYAFFASHIPITLLVDSQALLPSWLFPAFAKGIVRYHVDTFKDPLMALPPTWFKSLIASELVFQLPFFFFALRALQTRGNWIRIPGIIYSAHVVTTMIPVLSSLLFGEGARGSERGFFSLFLYVFDSCAFAAGLSLRDRLILAAVYAPYLLIPLHYGYTLATHTQPYGCDTDPKTK